MIATEFDDVHRDSASSFSRWLIPALVLSLLFHLVFCLWARSLSLPSTGREVYERIVPRAFQLERVEIDSKLLAPEEGSEKQASLAPQSVILPDEKASFEKLMADNKGEPAAPKIDQSVLSEKPTASSTTLEETTQMAKRSGAESILEDTRALQKALLAEKPSPAGRPTGKVLDPQALTGRAIAKTGPLRGGDTPGFSNLDDLLAQTGPLRPKPRRSSCRPICFLTMADTASPVKPMAGSAEARDSLNPTETHRPSFVIEGHTDSFGSDESQYGISARTAPPWSKSGWSATMNISRRPHLPTEGYGETRLIAPASGTH